MSNTTVRQRSGQGEAGGSTKNPTHDAASSDEPATTVLETLAPVPSAPEFASVEVLKSTHHGFGAPY